MTTRKKKRVAKKSGVSAGKKKSTKKASAPKKGSAKASARKKPAPSAKASAAEKTDVVYSDVRGSMRAMLRRRFL